MYYVYCLGSSKTSKYHYYGFSQNLDTRLQKHNNGGVKSTKRYIPLHLIGYKTFKDKKDALAFEKKIKTNASARENFLKEITFIAG